MSLAENLLNSLDETAYQNSRIAGIEPEEEHIKVGQDRVITVPNVLKTIAVKGDKDVETATIDCVRYWDGNDLSTFAIYLNYILPNGDEGTYIPESIKKSEDIFSFDWKIGSEFTYAQGKLTFWIVTKLTDDNGELVKQWSSFQNSDCSIAQGGDKIYVPEKQTDQDVISQAISISRASAEHAEQQANLAIEAANKAALDASQAAEEEVSRIIGELGVVQELGDSPNSVVSQAKVTKEFVNTNANVSRNTKAIANIMGGIPLEEFETDDSVAYQKYVPANALPYAEIEKIGGMTYKDGDTLCSAKVTEVKSVGVNLIPYPYRETTKTENGITFTDIGDGTIIANGTATNDASFTLASNFSFKKGMVISGASNGSSSTFEIQAYKDAQNFISTNTGYGVANNDFVASPRIVIRKGYTANNLVFKPMLNIGTIALPYTPYFHSTLPISEAMQAIEGYGEGINDTCYNYIDWDKKQFVKRAGVVDLGTLNWEYVADVFGGVFRTTLTTMKQNTADSICSKYQVVESNLANYEKALYAKNNGNIVFVKDTAYTDAASFKSAMSGVMLVYELAEPIVTDISDLITSDNLIGVEGGGTLTFQNEYGYAVPSEVEYQVEV